MAALLHRASHRCAQVALKLLQKFCTNRLQLRGSAFGLAHIGRAKARCGHAVFDAHDVIVKAAGFDAFHEQAIAIRHIALNAHCKLAISSLRSSAGTAWAV